MSFDPKDFNDIADIVSYRQRRDQLEKQDEIARLLRQQEAEQKRQRTLSKCPACATRIENNVTICKACRKELIWVEMSLSSSTATFKKVFLKERSGTAIPNAIEEAVSIYNSKHADFFRDLEQSDLLNRIYSLRANVGKHFESFPQAITDWNTFGRGKFKTQNRIKKLKEERDFLVNNGYLMAGGGLGGFFLIMCCGGVIKPETSGGVFMLFFCLIAFPLAGFFSGRIFAKVFQESEIGRLKQSLETAVSPQEFESHITIKDHLEGLATAHKDLATRFQTIQRLLKKHSAYSSTISAALPLPIFSENLSPKLYGQDIAKTLEEMDLLFESNGLKASNTGSTERLPDSGSSDC